MACQTFLVLLGAFAESEEERREAVEVVMPVLVVSMEERAAVGGPWVFIGDDVVEMGMFLIPNIWVYVKYVGMTSIVDGM